MRTAIRTTTALLAAGALSLGVATSAQAADPADSTLTAPAKPGSVTSTWTGAFDYPGLELAFLLAYDDHALTIAIPGKSPEKFFKKKSATLDIDLTWDGGSSNDMDLYVYDAAGNEVASSGQAATENEHVTIPVTAGATYTVEVTNYLSTPGVTYTATATLTTAKAAK